MGEKGSSLNLGEGWGTGILEAQMEKKKKTEIKKPNFGGSDGRQRVTRILIGPC